MHRSHRRHAPLALAVALLMLLAGVFGASLTNPSTASACPIQGCHVPPDDPPPPPPGPPAPPAPKYRVSILSIHPYQTEDSFVDEAYIKINGSKVWGPHDITALQTLYPNVVRDVTSSISIALYDEDSPDPDDKLGTVYPSLPALGSSYAAYMDFWGDGAHYVMLVQVSRLS